MKYFDSYDSLRKEDPKTFKLIGELGESLKYKFRRLDNGSGVWDMENGGWFIVNNPYFVTDAQWRTLALRHFAFESLQDKPLKEIVKDFHYVQEVVVVAGDRFYVPSGCIDGHLQGMFMRINADGEINT